MFTFDDLLAAAGTCTHNDPGSVLSFFGAVVAVLRSHDTTAALDAIGLTGVFEIVTADVPDSVSADYFETAEATAEALETAANIF